MAVRGEAQARARAHVLQVLEACGRTGASRLPSVRRLAAQSGCTQSVVWRAIAGLRGEGVLQTRWGAWVSPAGSTRADDAPGSRGALAEHKPKWERLAVALGEDVFLGHYPAGSLLPGPKALAEQHGVSYRTLRKAMDALVRHGSVVAHRRGYRVPPLDGRRHNGSLLLIARGNAKLEPRFLGPRGVELFRLLEGECARARVALEFLPYDYINARLYPTPRAIELLHRRPAGEPVQGVMIWSSTVQNPGPGRHDNLVALLRDVLPLDVPVVLLSETGEREQEALALGADRLTVVSLSHSPLAGERVGHRLLALGHRRAVYLSTNHEAIWSRNRLAGLVRAFGEAGEDCAVRGVVRADVTDHPHTQEFRARLDTSFGRLMGQCRRRGSGVVPELRRALDSLAEDLGDEALRAAERKAMAPLMEEAAALTDATAWVCANDAAALACLDFLGRRVPALVSVIGFDDTAQASARRLSSYNFDCAGAIHASLQRFFGPQRWPPHERGDQRIEIEGYVVERQTTAPARRRPGP